MHKNKSAAHLFGYEEDGANDSKENEVASDYLTPYLPITSSSSSSSSEDKIVVVSTEVAKQAYELCLKALKERLVERANIIQRRLEKENEALAKRQAAFQRSRDATQGADEEYEKFCVDAMFRIQILEQRLQKHEDTAMSKYEALIKRLQEDPRLAAMRGIETGNNENVEESAMGGGGGSSISNQDGEHLVGDGNVE